jgi:hypothetical protein
MWPLMRIREKEVKKSEEEKMRNGGMRQAVVPDNGVRAQQMGKGQSRQDVGGSPPAM